MMNSNTKMTAQELEQMIAQMEKIFTVVRILDKDLLHKMDVRNGELRSEDCKCYSFWEKGKNCENCVAQRALAMKGQCTKLEFIGLKMYQVIAKYLEVDGVPCVVEMISCLDDETLLDAEGRETLVKKFAHYRRELYADALTRSYSRRYFEDQLKEQRMDAGIAMIDLDDLKTHNDTYGHVAGDKVLVTVSAAIISCVRKTDRLVRYGGDEFLLVMPGISLEAFVEKLHRIQNVIHGKMGQVITRLVSEDNECEIVAGFDVNDSIENTYPVFTNPDEFTGDADVIIDFSHPSALTTVLNYCKKRKLPVILATTGYTDEQKKEFTEASKEIPVFFSANMSLGINLIIALAKKATKLLEGNFDIEIVERHHNQKIDAPSGTALAIADAIDETLSYPAEYVYDRHAVRRKRKPTEIGIHAVRGGTIVGDHEVIFAGTDEVIELKHSAHSKEVFAVGAIKAAKFMSDKPAGMYSMNDLISTL